MTKPAWMHKDFRYAPSTPEAVEARAKCVPGPDYAPYRIAALQEEVARLRQALTEKTA